MSLTFTRLAAKAKGLTPRAKNVLRVLADRADSKGRSFPSQDRLAEDTGLSARTVWTALKELETCGWIIREKRFRRDGTRTSDLITIRDEEAAAAYVARMLRLPLMVALPGGQPVEKQAETGGDHSQHLRVVQSQMLRGNLSLKDSITDQMGVAAPAPVEGADATPEEQAAIRASVGEAMRDLSVALRRKSG